MESIISLKNIKISKDNNSIRVKESLAKRRLQEEFFVRKVEPKIYFLLTKSCQKRAIKGTKIIKTIVNDFLELLKNKDAASIFVFNSAFLAFDKFIGKEKTRSEDHKSISLWFDHEKYKLFENLCEFYRVDKKKMLSLAIIYFLATQNEETPET